MKSSSPSSAKNPRSLALELLLRVEKDESYSNLLLPSILNKSELSASERAFVTELSYGTLRHQGTIDSILQLSSDRSLAKLDPAVLSILRLGSYQLLYTRVAAHAAVSESVKLARKAKVSSASGFINAILRKVSAKALSSWSSQYLNSIQTEAKPNDENNSAALTLQQTKSLAFNYSMPEWIVDSFSKTLNFYQDSPLRKTETNPSNKLPLTRLESVLEANNQRPKISLARIIEGDDNPLDSSFTAKKFSPIGFEISSGNPANLAEIQSGQFRVQDEGSQLVALSLIEASEVEKDELWLDLCAGPGGKTAILASQAKKLGAKVIANELHPHRSKLVEDSVASFKDIVTVQTGDGRALVNQPQKYNRILLDAPCSGIGALRRRPEARWRKTEAELNELLALQSDLLETAVSLLLPGGVLAYITCSPDLRETVELVKQLETDSTLELLAADKIMQQLSKSNLNLPPNKFVQLWPDLHNTDAMFLALIRKKQIA